MSLANGCGCCSGFRSSLESYRQLDLTRTPYDKVAFDFCRISGNVKKLELDRDYSQLYPENGQLAEFVASSRAVKSESKSPSPHVDQGESKWP